MGNCTFSWKEINPNQWMNIFKGPYFLSMTAIPICCMILTRSSNQELADETSLFGPSWGSPSGALPDSSTSNVVFSSFGIMGGLVRRVTVILNPSVVWIVAPVVIPTWRKIISSDVSKILHLVFPLSNLLLF